MNRWLLLFLIALTGLRLFIGAQSELSPDEAYYYQWSQRLDWGYFSKGPGVAAAMKIGTSLFGPTELGVRFLSPLLALGTSCFIFFLARRFFGAAVATWAVVLLNVTPIFQAGALVMTIDPLSIFFWAGALWAFWMALEKSPKFSPYWLLTGLFLGLGFLSKYTNAMQLVSVALVLVLIRRFRNEFRRPGFWAMMAVFILCVIPPVIWNYQHDWITASHISDDGGFQREFRFRPEEPFVFLGLHFGVYSPLIFAGMMIALYRACREARRNTKILYLTLFSLPLLVLYFLLSIRKAGEPNWTAPAFVSLGILASYYWYRWAERSRGAARFAVVALALAVVVSFVLVNPDALRRAGWNYTYDNDPSKRLRGWKSVAEAVGELRKEVEARTERPVFLIADKYQTTSALAFYLPEKRIEGPGHPPVYMRESQAILNQYAFWPRYDQMIEPGELAHVFLKDRHVTISPEHREALTLALKSLEDPSPENTGEERTLRRRALIRTLLEINPNLPMDEFASDELGISLFYGRDAFYISDSAGNRLPTAIENAFEEIEMIALWEQKRRGLRLRTIRVYHCKNYRTLPL